MADPLDELMERLGMVVGTGARPLAPCGTTAAYSRHRRRGEEPCQPCRDAYNASQRARYRRARRRAGLPACVLAPCGTPSARRRHRRRAESCPDCALSLKPCGTPAAYKRHRRRGEEPCQPCRDAYNAWQRRLKQRRKEGTR
ncbi:hypothetical protein GCM10027160_29370 [Streptomyces calidiresistens]|uniref:Uncharacterized protein n=1 Tax=Streptomyces calidiresistens TaxID=1485586 RepID=A0A7W3T1E7_9ACTN|nr:hypothetical protein [Streptomyces calidiresistens]MBB0229142.1 hypothetical protein [Streptomyces calidiresistens]